MAGMFDDLVPGAGGSDQVVAMPGAEKFTTPPTARITVGGPQRLEVSPLDRDLLIRTVIGEAGNQDDLGKAAVANVVMNRLRAGNYGKDVKNVVLAKNQFEPWQTKAGELFAIKPDSPEYQKAAGIVDSVLAGGEDPTKGAVNFLNPDIVKQRTGGKLPSWAQGEGQRIGQHVFFGGKADEDQPRLPDDARPSTATKGLNFDDLVPAGGVTPAVSAKPEDGKMGRGEAFLTGARAGATLNFGDELEGLKAAGGNSLPGNSIFGIPVDSLTGAGRMLYERLMGALGHETGNEATKNYEAARDAVRAEEKKAEHDRPGYYMAGNVAGSVALPGGAALKGAKLGERVVSGAKVGGITGALMGAGAGEDIAGRAEGAVEGGVMGTVAGGAAPVLVKGAEAAVSGARKAISPIVNSTRGFADPEGEAARRVVTAIRRDANNNANGLSGAEFVAERRAGQPVALADLGGETTRALARSAANTSQEGRQALETLTSDRFATQSPRLSSWLKTTFNFPDSAAALDKIKNDARISNRPAYARAYKEGSGGVWNDDLEQLVQAPVVQDAIRRATVEAKNWAVREGFSPPKGAFVIENGATKLRQNENSTTLPSLQLWDYVKRALDADKSPQAQAYSRTLRSVLDDVVPSYATARSGAAQAFGQQDALEAGAQFLFSKMENAEAKRNLAAMTPAERKLFETGFVSNLIAKVEESGDRRSILNSIANTPAARERIELAIGPQKAKELEAKLRVEGVMDMLRGAVSGNSTTARQLTELGLAGGTYGIGTGGNVFDPNPTAAMNAALVYGLARGKGKIDQNVSRRVAEMLASNDPSILRKGISIVAKNDSMMNALRALDARIAKGGASQTEGALPAVTGTAASRADQEQNNRQ